MPCTARRSLSARVTDSSSTTTAASWSSRASRRRGSPSSAARNSSSRRIPTCAVARPPTCSGRTRRAPTSTSSSGTIRRSSAIRWPAGREVIARLGLFLLLAAALLTGRTTVSASQRQTPPARSVVVVSDLHMGEGREPSGEWNAYEDFRWADEFAAFLNASDREGQSAVDLILNGDTFELLQSTHGDCTGPTDSVGCSEAEASQRLERVLAAHATELKALAQFARQGANRVVFVAGDHDAALLFARLGRRVVSALAVPGNRVEVAQKGYWLSPDGLVYAEHGHQIGNDAHRFEGWPAPFVAAAGGQRLQRPWGEAVAQRIHNQYEPRFPIIDSMAVLGTGIKYALSEAGAELKAIPSLVRYLLFASSWQRFRMELDDGDVRAPTWDIAQVRAQGASFLISSIPDDDPFKPTVAQAAAATGLAS